jgi:hypothetical protein
LTSNTCELLPLARYNGWPCGIQATTDEHILPRQFFRGNKEGRKLAEGKYADIFIGRTCLICNSVTKFADTTEAKAFLLKQRKSLPNFWEAIAAVQATFKGDQDWLRREYLESLWAGLP